MNRYQRRKALQQCAKRLAEHPVDEPIAIYERVIPDVAEDRMIELIVRETTATQPTEDA